MDEEELDLRRGVIRGKEITPWNRPIFLLSW
jgi:hypothetical protein